MNVGQLRKALEGLPDHTPVVIDAENDDKGIRAWRARRMVWDFGLLVEPGTDVSDNGIPVIALDLEV